MIDFEYKKAVLTCDDCSTSVVFDTFDDALTHAKKNGWNCTRENGDWENYCPECVASL